jgi:cytochrome c-type biogenesis protein CcmH/NrfF
MRRVAELALLALICVGAGVALAAPPPAEHVPAGMGMGNAGGGWAAQNRPPDEVSKKAMQELICPCGCARQDIFDCDCATAAQLRGKVLALIHGTDDTGKPLFDLTTEAGRQKAYDSVLAGFVKEYGGEQILATPQNRFSWLFPSLAVAGGLSLLIVAGRRWVKGGRSAAAARAAPAHTAVEDDDYADKLDDELRDTD